MSFLQVLDFTKTCFTVRFTISKTSMNHKLISGLANVLILIFLILYKKNFCGGKNVLIFSYIILINTLEF